MLFIMVCGGSGSEWRLQSDLMDDSIPSNDKDLLTAVPLFPLPNVVLFPHAVLPLHIFEERYKTMTAEALTGRRQIAMALLRPGWEKSYYGKPQIDPIVCVGTIVTHEQLPDGKYNLLLQGHTRARIIDELPGGDRMYRVARLEPLREIPVLEIDLGPQRQRLIELFSTDPLAGVGLASQFRKLLASPWPTPDIVDLAAFSYFEDALLKQSLLAELDVRRRVDRAVSELESLSLRIHPVQSSLHPPSMN